MVVHLVHTAEVHKATFDRLRDEIAAGVTIEHHVKEAWLTRARAEDPGGLQSEIADYLDSLAGPVLCTCSTIGPMAEKSGALRLDWPMMQAAAHAGDSVLLVYCLESTAYPSRLLLQRAGEEENLSQETVELFLPDHWKLFEQGHTDAFLGAVAKDIEAAVMRHPDVKAVILAQASMAGAAEKLCKLDIPIFSSPRLALQAVLAMDEVKAS